MYEQVVCVCLILILPVIFSILVFEGLGLDGEYYVCDGLDNECMLYVSYISYI